MNFTKPFSLFRSVMILGIFAVGLVSQAQAKKKESNSPMLKIICSTVLEGHEEYVLASQDSDKKLREVETVKLRASLITPWIEAPQGELQLCVREDRKLVPTCTFTMPEGTQNALLILLPGEDKKNFTTQLVDTGKVPFTKGDILIVNSSKLTGTVMLGEKSAESKAGEVSVQKPTLDDKGMLHMLVSYKDESGNEVTCSDTYVPGNAGSRDFLFLIADPNLGLRVSSLPDFGPFE